MELAIPSKNPIVIALQSDKIMSLKKQDVVKSFVDLFTITYFEAGQVVPGFNTKAQANYLQTLSQALHEEIKTYFPFLRTEEIKIAFSKGVRNEYGEYFGLNIKTFHGWIRAWQFDEKRKSAMESIKRANEREYAPVMSEDEAEYIWKQTILKQFAEFKKTGILQCEFPNHLYGFFEKRGDISLTVAQKKEIYEMAKGEVVEAKKQARLNPKSKFHLSELSDFIKRAESNALKSDEQNQIKQQARRISIINYYKSIEVLEL